MYSRAWPGLCQKAVQWGVLECLHLQDQLPTSLNHASLKAGGMLQGVEDASMVTVRHLVGGKTWHFPLPCPV